MAEEEQRARNYVRQVARHREWVVNPDVEFTAIVIGGLEKHSSRLGKPYCPCRDVDGGEADRDIICPCAYASADIAEHGQCYCGLFLALGKNPESVASIPERRS